MMQDISWRPYQIECKKEIRKEYNKGGNKQLIVAATGVGKRIMSINLMQHFKRSLFIAHREELIGQAYDDIVRFFPMQCGIVKGPRFEIDKRIVVASVQTLMNRLDKIHPETFDNIIIDESHHYASTRWLATVRHFKPKLLTGWTATPKRLDGLSLNNLFQKIVYRYTIEDGIHDGWLAEIDAFQIQTQVDLSGVKRVAGDFNQKQLAERVDSRARNALIVDRYGKYCKGEQALAFCVDIDHTYNLRDIFREAGFRAESIVSDKDRCPNRAEILDRFSKGKVDILTNVNILTEGFDYADVGAILMARPTQSESLYVQCLDDQTEILTDHGWRSINTYELTDLAAGYNIATGEVKWQPTLKIYKREKGELEYMYSVDLPQTDIRVTGGHRMITKKRTTRKRVWSEYEFVEAEKFAESKDLMKIPISGIQKTTGLLLTNPELEFLGLFLSDGSRHKTTNQIYIAQSEHQKWNKNIVQILDACKFKYRISRKVRKTQYSDHSVMLYYHISNKSTKRFRKWLVKSMGSEYEPISASQLEHLIYGIYLGDGSKTDKIDWVRHTYTISTGNKDFADYLQSLCVRRGFKCNLARISYNVNPAYLLHIKPFETEKSLMFSDNRPKFSKEELTSDSVWCIENPMQTIITRRNGKVSILGNCIGRGTRLKTEAFQQKFNHAKCVVLDFVDNSAKHSLINAYELERGKAIEDRIFISDSDREKLLEAREKRITTIEADRTSDRKINLLKLPTLTVWQSEKMLEPASEKQIEWIKNLGLWQEDTEYTKMMASEIIGSMPATVPQREELRMWGYDINNGATRGQYSRIKFTMDRKNKYKMKE